MNFYDKSLSFGEKQEYTKEWLSLSEKKRTTPTDNIYVLYLDFDGVLVAFKGKSEGFTRIFVERTLENLRMLVTKLEKLGHV